MGETGGKLKMKSINKRTLLIHFIGFVVARASFYGMNPLAIGYFTASYLGKTGGGLAFSAAFLGVASVMNPSQILKYSLAMIGAVILIESPLLKNRNIPKTICYVLPSLLLAIFSMVEIETDGLVSKSAALSILEAVISVISAAMFKNGIDYIVQAVKGFKMNNEQMVSTAIIVAVVIYAIPDFGISYIAPMETAVFFIILFFTYKYGVGQGTITGAVCGFVLSLRGAPISDVAMFTMMGIIPAIFREMGRFPTASIYMITAALMGIVNESMELNIKEIGALVSAIILYLLLPGSLIYRVDAAGGTGRQELLASQNLKRIAKTRMKIFSESFLKLSKTLDTITEKQTKLKQNEINSIFEDISEKLCKNCSNCNQCWENNFKQTYQAACTMFEVAEKKGIIKMDDIPTDFLEDCICANEFIAETNRGFEIAKLNQVWHSRISESREVIAEQLKEVSSVIQDITGDIYGAVEVARSEEERVIKRLRSERIITKEITIFDRGDKRKEIYLTASCKGGRCITAKEAAFVISDVLGVKVKVSEASKAVISKEFESFIFVEDTKFKILNGVARAMKESVSGDNFSILKLETGEYMLALSDGMGTGKDAGDESEMVMSLLEQMIESGFKAETAIKLINSSLVLKSDRQTFSTIDMSIINLFTGMCEFIKIGAAAAFIKRDNWVETISSTTLPIGMFGNVDYDTVTKKLYEGDIIIMVTDGVLDSIKGDNKEACMEQMILEIKSKNPQEIANRILDKTLSQSNFTPMDDMTVITAGIWLK
ncbi:MAG: stage II sporulation protein E [Herbinix sp.]|nr:stage II sporulation protein E [Herbinix sp.]